MRTIAVFFILVCCSYAGAANLVSQYFEDTTGFPYGWTNDPSIPNWGWWNTSYAGGTPGELRLSFDPTQSGTLRFISPVFDTQKVHDMTLSFRHRLDDHSFGIANYTIGVAISTNLSTWTTLWSVTTSSSIPATQVTVDPVSFELGKSETTYISFFFTGNTYNDIEAWSIDDIQLSYSNTLGNGTWEWFQFNSIVGNLIIPDGYTLQLMPGGQLEFEPGKALFVFGRLLASGQEYAPIYMTSASGLINWSGICIDSVNPANDSTLINHTYISNSYGGGIYINNTDKVRVSHCNIFSNSAQYGAGIYACNSNIVIEYCFIHNNTSEDVASGIYCLESEPTINNNTIQENTSTEWGGALSLLNCIWFSVKNNIIVQNYCPNGGAALYLDNSSSYTKAMYNVIASNQGEGVYFSGSSLGLHYNDIAYNSGYGLQMLNGSGSSVLGSIFWGNGSNEIYNSPGCYLDVRYSCLQDNDIGGSFPPPQQYLYNINSNPLFVNPVQELDLRIGPYTLTGICKITLPALTESMV